MRIVFYAPSIVLRHILNSYEQFESLLPSLSLSNEKMVFSGHLPKLLFLLLLLLEHLQMSLGSGNLVGEEAGWVRECLFGFG